ncbi:LysE family transporter [Micromonospora sp. NBC_01813]|uniref:LysE family transporter n=1 Tax=Micromonospora sp. NBC_01813 TaxID=2975988 RepID=UPI002DD9EBDF|nr:LysE family transporter [Micromonospora sp. NBC_01813]WSA06365.1 LysE family transporter [Micromonospora sp. NBC_01813]
MVTVYLGGLLLGLGLIMPIGPQNVFVVNQGLAVGLPRALWAVLAAGCCDTLLIVAGVAGVSGLIATVPGVRPALLVFGAVFLSYLGVRSIRTAGGQLTVGAPDGVLGLVPDPGGRRRPGPPPPDAPGDRLVRPAVRRDHAGLRRLLRRRVGAPGHRVTALAVRFHSSYGRSVGPLSVISTVGAHTS